MNNQPICPHCGKYLEYDTDWCQFVCQECEISFDHHETEKLAKQHKPDFEQCVVDMNFYLTQIHSIIWSGEPWVGDIEEQVNLALRSFAVNVIGVDDPNYQPINGAIYDMNTGDVLLRKP